MVRLVDAEQLVQGVVGGPVEVGVTDGRAVEESQAPAHGLVALLHPRDGVEAQLLVEQSLGHGLGDRRVGGQEAHPEEVQQLGQVQPHFEPGEGRGHRVGTGRRAEEGGGPHRAGEGGHEPGHRAHAVGDHMEVGSLGLPGDEGRRPGMVEVGHPVPVPLPFGALEQRGCPPLLDPDVIAVGHQVLEE